MKEKKKQRKVHFSQEVLEKLSEMPDEVYKEFEKIVKKIKTGELDLEKVDTPIIWEALRVRLRCPECDSSNVEWLLDKSTSEVTFLCLVCNESFWTSIEDYQEAIRKHPDKVIS